MSAIGRIAVVSVGPSLEEGRWSAKAVVGEAVPITATVFREGHGMVGATVVITLPDGTVTTLPMDAANPGIALFRAHFIPSVEGEHSFRVEGWADPVGSWEHTAAVKLPTGTDAALVLAEGAAILERARDEVDRPAAQRKALTSAVAVLRDPTTDPAACLDLALTPAVCAALAEAPLRDSVTPSREYPLRVDRERALFSAWYEFFPRSEGAVQDPATGRWTSGTFETAARRLPAIAAMGFDVVYLTPIHPIGSTYRKGPDNALTASSTDPGSPYAIGSADGGHDAVHPDLGTMEDFWAFVAAARGRGLEVALDIALQCSPDHPWVREHPEWFSTRADGSIAYAENPPKKYHDIYPLSFERDPEGILREVRRILEVWIDAGVTVFRMDNPHTKPLPFWEELLADVASTHPEVIFLSEAFTRPPMMHTLAKIGFHQSMTYFTWRPTAPELGAYLEELSGEASFFMRPNFFPTTPDILTPDLQGAGAPVFAARAVAAATGSPSWGIYSGYELVEDEARPDAEEQRNNEKYEYRPRDWTRAKDYGIEALLTILNATRRAHPALQRLRGLTVHTTDNPAVLCYSRHIDAAHSPSGKPDTVVVALSLDGRASQEATIYLDPTAFGLPDGPFGATDALSGADLAWGPEFHVSLGPDLAMAIVGAVHHKRPNRSTGRKSLG
ncbi:MAG: DUF3416 domain-containing protein [Demequinaceae bacterium]|nr:DUF3416 domain-containing protein [Demequinaceae bacterium]